MWHGGHLSGRTFGSTSKAVRFARNTNPAIKTPYGLLQSSQTTGPGHTLGMDRMGPFLTSKKQNTFLLVIVDYYTNWVEMFLLRDAKTQKIVKSYVARPHKKETFIKLLIKCSFDCWYIFQLLLLSVCLYCPVECGGPCFFSWVPQQPARESLLHHGISWFDTSNKRSGFTGVWEARLFVLKFGL